MRCTYFAQRRARCPHHPLPPDTPTLFTWTRRRTLTKGIAPTSRMFSTVLCFTTTHGVERSRTKREGVAGPTSAASSNRVILLMMDVLLHMLEYRRDHQNLHMSPRSGDAHILQWAKNVGDIEDHRLQAELYNT